MKHLLYITLFLLSFQSFAQEPKIIGVPDEPAIYEDGKLGKQSYFKDSLKYPVGSEKQGIHGVVRIYAIIDTLGRVVKTEITSGINGECDAEATRLVRGMGTWTPAKDKGEKVFTRVLLSIYFTPDPDKIDEGVVRPQEPIKPMTSKEIRDYLKNKKNELNNQRKKDQENNKKE